MHRMAERAAEDLARDFAGGLGGGAVGALHEALAQATGDRITVLEPGQVSKSGAKLFTPGTPSADMQPGGDTALHGARYFAARLFTIACCHELLACNQRVCDPISCISGYRSLTV